MVATLLNSFIERINNDTKAVVLIVKHNLVSNINSKKKILVVRASDWRLNKTVIVGSMG